MRRTILALLLAFGLLLAPLAMAAGGPPAGKGQGKASEARAARAHGHGNDTDADDASSRPAWVGAWHERLQALLGSMRENLTRVHDECRSAPPEGGDNATREDRLAWAHCVRDGFREWRDEYRAMRDEARAERKDARMAASSG